MRVECGNNDDYKCPLPYEFGRLLKATLICIQLPLLSTNKNWFEPCIAFDNYSVYSSLNVEAEKNMQAARFSLDDSNEGNINRMKNRDEERVIRLMSHLMSNYKTLYSPVTMFTKNKMNSMFSKIYTTSLISEWKKENKVSLKSSQELKLFRMFFILFFFVTLCS